MIITDYIEKNDRVYPDKTAIVSEYEDRRCSFRELKERVYKLANGLLKLGVNRGDRVAIIQDNCFEYPEMYFAIGKIGGVVTPLNYRLIGVELVYLLNHSESNILIIGKDFVKSIDEFKSDLKFINNYICIGDNPESMINYDELLSRSSNQKPESQVNIDDLFCLLYTGGTTGKPKGVMLSHRNLTAACTTWIVEWGISHSDVNMIVTPLFHTGSNWGLFSGFMLGNTQVILKGFEIERMFKTIEKERVTYSVWLSAIIGSIINYPRFKEFDLSSLKLITTGGGPLGEAQLKRLIEFVGCRVLHGGGQTEAGPICVIRLEEHLDGPKKKLGSAGKEAFNIEMRVVDENDNDVPLGGVGELCAKGDAVMQGYWKMPEETASSMKDGWQHTGDLVRIDEDGYIYYVDRLKDMIKSGGENVYSKEVEDIIYAHPAVSEVAVIGIPDEKWGESVKALVILKKGQKVSEEEIISNCKKYLAGFKCPKSVEFYDSFPKTGLDKIAKNILRDKYWKGHEKRIH